MAKQIVEYSKRGLTAGVAVALLLTRVDGWSTKAESEAAIVATSTASMPPPNLENCD